MTSDATGPRAGLPDPRASRAVLVGVSDYASLEKLPAVGNNIDTLRQVLTDPDLWGLPEEHCVALLNPASVDDVLEAVHAAASEAADALVFYFAGHGLLDDRSDLYLALPGAASDRLYRAVRYDDIRREIVGTARACYGKVAILDCCYSGRALQGGMGGSVELADHARVDGTYLMTASAETSVALAPPDEDYTAFTGALVDKLLHGLPDGPDLLDMETLFYSVRVDLQARHFPVPQQRTRNDGKAIALVRNRHCVGPRTAREPAADAVRALPQPPPGLEGLLRRRPADMYAEVQALRAHGHAEVAEEVLAASAALRADQEVAAIISLLRRQGTGEDVRTVLAAAAQRPPAEVLRIVDALRDTDLPDLAAELVRAVGRCRFADTANLAHLLQDGGRAGELVELLNAAFGAAQAEGSLIELVNALWLAGLRDEVDRLIVRAASRLPGADIAVLADELREVGREEVAFGLYAAAADAVATRPVSAVTQLCQAMTRAGRAEDSAAVAQGAVQRAHDVEALLDLASAFWVTGQAPHADRTLRRAAEVLSNADVTALAAALRLLGHDNAAYRLCLRATDFRPASAVLEIVDALREEGRPVDAKKLLEQMAGQTAANTMAELLDGCDDVDRQRILRAAVERGAGFCAELLAALGPARPALARRFTDLVAESVADHPELIGIIIDHLGVSEKEQMFASLAESSDPRALVELARTLPPAEAGTLVFLAVVAGRPALADVLAALPDQLSGQPVERLGALVRGLRPGFPAYADAVLAEAAAPGRGERAIVHDVVFLFGSGEAEVGAALLRQALQGRSSTELKSIVATLREQNRPEPLAAAADWVRETYSWMGSNADGILRQLGLRDHASRKAWLPRRRS
ncbi:caspase, EACC1-associated type [Amycolatopsis sp. cmx-4-68]|uniref:caspase, EACC1-associated type n=1 Tax=Amycolatopsis sp. cmx-4-68 TaxID=2790938 RepID=UPI003978EBA1